MTDHKQQALDLLGSVHLDTGDVYDQSIGADATVTAAAEVHATLYLAEQQRIANLIALAASPVTTYDWIVESPDSATMIRDEIRKALGVS